MLDTKMIQNLHEPEDFGFDSNKFEIGWVYVNYVILIRTVPLLHP